MATSEVPRGQWSLFPEPVWDIWHTEQLRRMAESGTYWTPEGPRNGHYTGPEHPEPEPVEPCRARTRGRASKHVVA